MHLYHFLILLWSTTLQTSHSSQQNQQMEYLKALNDTVQVMERLLSFYEDQVNAVNLDAIYGLRVTEGALAVSLSEHGETFWQTVEMKNIYKRLNKLQQLASSINNRAQASIEKQATDYYYKFKDIVVKPWIFFKDFGYRKLPVDEVKVIKVKNETPTWDESTSDRCMSEVLGTNPNHTKCSFTSVCMNAITDLNQIYYGPTHQILFLTLALMYGCEVKYSKFITQRLGYDVDGLIENRCVRVMSEMMGLEEPSVQVSARDLYMEQSFVCSLHGYEEFLNLIRLGNILSWQRNVGCFGTVKDEVDDDKETGAILPDERKRGTLGDSRGRVGTFGANHEMPLGSLEGNVGHRTRKNVGSFGSMRRLLVDVSVAHDCSAHESGVAAGLLGCYTKWLLTKLDTGKEEPSIVPNTKTTETVLTNNNQPHETSTKNRPTTGKMNKDKNKLNGGTFSSTNKNKNIETNKIVTTRAEKIYMRSLVISFVTSFLTAAVVLSLYKIAESCLSRNNRSKGQYKRLIDA